MAKYLALLAHPIELTAVVQYKFFKFDAHPKDPSRDRASLVRTYELLRLTLRLFAVVIQELHPELRDAIAVFYLVLRALDTIEDDMGIDVATKVPLLETFHEKLDTEDWTFTGSSPGEKDRVVLEEFDVILSEYHRLRPEYKAVIREDTERMAFGMSHYVQSARFNKYGVELVADYDLYCHYVAGLVGDGLTKIIAAAGFAVDVLPSRMFLAESMGLFLQKVNITRDYYEDLHDGRAFWPQEIWGRHATTIDEFLKSTDDTKGLQCVAELVENALEHAPDVLHYLLLITDPSAFNFCAIPQVMAIATLELVFQNPKVLHQRAVKIPKTTTVQLMLKLRLLPGVVEIFREYVTKIHHKSKVSDANYLTMGIICGKIIQRIELMYPVGVPEGVTVELEPKRLEFQGESTFDKNGVPERQEVHNAEIVAAVANHRQMDAKAEVEAESERSSAGMVVMTVYAMLLAGLVQLAIRVV